MTVKLSTLGVGDVIKAERTMRVTRVDNAYGDVQLEDVRSGQTFVVDFDSNQGSWKPTLVSKAAPKFKVGDEIRGCEAFDSLPKGAVLTDHHGDLQNWVIADGEGGLLGTHGGVWSKGKTFGARTIVYLP